MTIGISEKVREFTIADMGTFQVSNIRGILNPGKFEGEQLHTVRDYASENHGDSFGDCSEWVGFYWEANGRYYREDTQGFVSELSFETYKTDEEAWFLDNARQEEHDNAIEEAEEALAAAVEDDAGLCEQCQALMINSVRCHETGCPVERNIQNLRRRLEIARDY